MPVGFRNVTAGGTTPTPQWVEKTGNFYRLPQVGFSATDITPFDGDMNTRLIANNASISFPKGVKIRNIKYASGGISTQLLWKLYGIDAGGNAVFITDLYGNDYNMADKAITTDEIFYGLRVNYQMVGYGLAELQVTNWAEFI